MSYYARYRKWASKFDQTAIVAIGATAGLAAAIVVAFAGPAARQTILWRVLPWFALVGAPLAAFDAWAAANFHGRGGEGAVRAASILVLLWGFAGYAFLR